MKNKVENQDNFVEFIPNNIQGDFITPVGSTPGYTEVIGVGGKVRHAGVFSDDNYYASILGMSPNNKDSDALFERAVEKEADIATWKMQQEYAREVLLEQRSFDDPSAQISRERRAGINSDLIGGTGGSSSGGASAQQTVPTMSDVTAQTKFKNAYDDTAEVFNGINTAVNVISSVANFGTSIAQSIRSLATLPSSIRAINAQNSVVSTTADDIIAISGDDRLKSDLSIINAGAETLARLSGLIIPESTDDEINSLLSSTGISADNVDSYRNAIRYLHKNPQVLADFEEGKKRQNELSEFNKAYTPEVIGDMITQGMRIKQAQLNFQEDYNNFQAKVAEYINTESNARNSAEITADSLALKAKSIKRDLQVYVDNINQIVIEEKRIDKLIDLYKKDVIGKRKYRSNWTDADYLVLDALRSQKAELHALGSNELENLYTISRTAHASYYMNKKNIDHFGDVEPIPGIQKHQNFVGYNYSSLYRGDVTPDVLTGNLLSLIPFVGGVAERAFTETYPQKSITINNW